MAVFLPTSGPLVEARFLERPNRFVVTARLAGGEEAVAHLPDPGRLTELLVAGRRIWLRPAPEAHRKTKWTAVLTESEDGEELVSIDSTLPNRLIRLALEVRAIDELADWRLERPEVALGRHRFDFLLRRGGEERMLLEVKSVTLARDGLGLFPDAVTARGRRHLDALAAEAVSGRQRAAVLFVVQRRDVREVAAERRIDPAFADALDKAASAGVALLARGCRVGLHGIELGGALAVRVGG